MSSKSSSLKQLALRGTAWTIVGYGLSQSLRFIGNIILTRLLFPELFGLMALVQVFITGLNLFSDIGIRPSIIQNPRGDDPEFLNTAWTLQVIRGFCLWLGCLILAFPVSKIYDEPKLLWLLPVVGLTTIIQGFNSTSLATLNRHVVVGKLTILQIGVQIISLTVMIIWAYFQQSVWALVIGNLLSSCVQMIISHFLNPLKNRLTWNRTAFREIVSFGRWIFISTAIGFLASQTDRLILGKLFSLEILGIYTIAFTLADIPRQVIGRLSSSVIFPVVSKYAHLPRKIFRDKVGRMRNLILVGLAFLVTGLVSLGDQLILFLYDERYAQAAWMMPLLSIGIWHTGLCYSSEPSLLATGKPVYQAWGKFFSFMFVVLGLPLGSYISGLFGIVVVASFSDLPLYGAVVYGLKKEDLSCFRQDLVATIFFLTLLTVVLSIRVALGYNLPIIGNI